MKTWKIAFFPLLVLFIYSCKKESGGERGNGQNGTAGDSTLLWQLIMIDTAQPAGSDTSIKYVFTYDNQGRMDQVNSYVPGVMHDVTQFYYQGSDTMANKMISRSDYGNFVKTDTAFFSYGQGYVNYDSSIMAGTIDREVRVNSYSRRGDTTVTESKISTFYPTYPTIVCHMTWIVINKYVNGNAETTDKSTSGNCGTNILWRQERQYDDKVNPLYRAGMHYRIAGLHFILNLMHAQRNNTISSSITSSTDNNFVYNYVYRSDGYPLVKWEKDLLDPSIYSKTFYIYNQ